jgi:hypothetical protein
MSGSLCSNGTVDFRDLDAKLQEFTRAVATPPKISGPLRPNRITCARTDKSVDGLGRLCSATGESGQHCNKRRDVGFDDATEVSLAEHDHVVETPVRRAVVPHMFC